MENRIVLILGAWFGICFGVVGTSGVGIEGVLVEYLSLERVSELIVGS